MSFRLPADLKAQVESEASERAETPADTLRRVVDTYFRGKRK
jgi:hypothetical protein